MQIRMLDTWAYDVVPGQIRRTLPAGQTFDEPVEIAQAAIAAGAAERIVAIASVADDVEPAEVDLEAGGDDQDDGEPDVDDDGDGDDQDDGDDADEGEPGSEDDGASPAPDGPVPASVEAAVQAKIGQVKKPAAVPAKTGQVKKAAAVVPAPADPVEPE